MTWIEGVGDEVPIFFILAMVVVAIFMILAWKSTDVPEPSLAIPVLTLNVSSRATPNPSTAATSNNHEPPNIPPQDSLAPETAERHPAPEEPPRQEEINTGDQTDQELTGVRRRHTTPLQEDSQDLISVKLMYMDDTQRLVETTHHTTIGDFKRKHFKNELNANKVVKLIFNGQVLSEDSSTLAQLGVDNNSVVHCLVHQPRASNNPPVATPTPATRHFSSADDPAVVRNASQASVADAGIDIGGLLVPLFGVIVGLLWYCRITYATHFTAAATTALVGLSGICIFSFLIIWYPAAEQEG